jgi:hypothetical protein
MASAQTPSVATPPATSGTTPIPKSYAKGIAMTVDPWEECARLEYGGDRSFAWSVSQQIVQTSAAGRAKLEEQLLAALALPDCTAAGRAFLCEMLALVGTAKSVPALILLLRDTEAADAARYALEAIPGPEAEAGLREALGALRGHAKAGLIGSIVARRDPAARSALTSLKDNPAEHLVVRETAEQALECLPPGQTR